jgi:hypothetical protein
VLNPPVADRPPPIPQAVSELWELVLAYFKQETTEPLKRLGRVIGFGIAGSLMLGVGVVFVATGLLRLLQHEGPNTFDGNWTFAPYIIVIVALLGTAYAVYALGTRAKKPSTPKPVASTNASTPSVDTRMPSTNMKDVRP